MATESAQLLMLFNWMSPTFPIGGFAYSHGLEQAIADGVVNSAETTEIWVADLLQSGSAWIDAVLFALCWNEDINELALALAGSAERYRETTELGRNFNIAANVWLGTELAQDHVAYPAAAGQACVNAGVEKLRASLAFLQGFAAAQVSVAVRLVPLGQTKGLQVLRNLSPLIEGIAQRAAFATRDDLGSNCVLAEIAAMKHETLQPRIFRT